MHDRLHHHRPSAPAGFTLIELLVAVAIVAIIAAVAFPSFQNSIRKSRRSDAFASVAAVQQAQERWRTNHDKYSTSVAGDLGITDPARYTVSVSAISNDDSLRSGYLVTAIGRNGQENDGDCGRLSLKLENGNLAYAACASCSTFTYALSNSCWSR